jgi:uncharacterized protein
MTDLGVALALVLVIEGLLWAIAPDSMKRAAAMALAVANSRLRRWGLGAATLGVAVVWLLRG